jgi:hypothetical protein
VTRLAIIIPHLGDVPSLETTLASVLANRPEDSEIFVVLLKPYKDPYEIEGEVQFVSGEPRGGLVGAVNLGVQLSSAPVIHVLMCGTEVKEGWADAALARLADPRIAAVAPLVLDAGDPARIVAAGLAYHVGGAILPLAEGREVSAVELSVKRVLAPHPAAAFYRRSAVEILGRFDAAVGGRWAGIDAGLMLQQLGWITVLEPCSRVTAPRLLALPAGAFRQALEAERFFWRWASILGRVSSLASHGLLVFGEGVRGLLNLSIVPRWAGRLVGGCLAAAAPGHRRRVKELQEMRSQSRPPAAAPPHFRVRRPDPPQADGQSAGRTRSAG